MDTLALIPIAALVLGNVSTSLTGLSGPGPARPGPDLIAVAGGAEVTADFGVVEYYPNLKSKLGLNSNVKRTELIDAVPFVAQLGPGLVCSNIEFDYWFKWPGIELPALQQRYEIPGDPTSRPTYLSATPGVWMTEYERLLGDLNVGQLVQLTGAPAQYQQLAATSEVHPEPTDPAAAADLIASWTAEAKHPYPVLWSLWNEPGHTLGVVEPEATAAASTGKRDGTKAERKAAREAAGAGRNNTRSSKREVAAKRGGYAEVTAELYSYYSAAMRPTIGRWSQFGLASFISADFNPGRATDTGRVFFDDVMDALDPAYAVDFLTFNSFNGAWPIILNGARAVTGPQSDKGPLIFTQFAPPGMKFNDDGSATKSSKITSSVMEVSLEMIDDYVQLTRATDVQHVCMAYWVGGDYGFLDSGGAGLRPTARFWATRMLMDLPTVRTRLDLGSGELEARGLRGLAGRNQGKVAVLLWNQGDKALSVPLTLTGVPAAMQSGPARLTVLDDDNQSPVTTRYRGDAVRVAPNGMALIEISADAVQDPLLLRNALEAADGDTRFLQTLSFPDRVAETCKRGLALPDTDACARNTGTYGFYDSVRSAAYLGMGDGRSAARVTATYSGLPEQVFAAADIFSVRDAAPASALRIAATFDACGQSVEARPVGGAPTYLLLDFRPVSAACRAGAATIELRLDDVPVGTQAEVLFFADEAMARTMAAEASGLIRATTPDIDEGLKVVKPRQDLD